MMLGYLLWLGIIGHHTILYRAVPCRTVPHLTKLYSKNVNCFLVRNGRYVLFILVAPGTFQHFDSFLSICSHFVEMLCSNYIVGGI